MLCRWGRATWKGFVGVWLVAACTSDEPQPVLPIDDAAYSLPDPCCLCQGQCALELYLDGSWRGDASAAMCASKCACTCKSDAGADR